MFNNFGLNTLKIFKEAEEERLILKHPYVGTEHLLLAILKNDKELSLYLKKYNITYDLFKEKLINTLGISKKEEEAVLYTPLLKRAISNSLDNVKDNITSKDLLISMLEIGEGIAIKVLIEMNIDIDMLYNDLSKSNIGNEKLELYETGTVLNDLVNKEEVVFGRDKEIDLIIETLLRKKKNNPLLIGDAGVGKTAIIEELTRRIMNKDVPEELYNTKVVSLEMGSLVSGTKYRGEFEEKLTKIIKEVENNNNIILFIDEIHSMVSAGGAEGAITAGDIFKPALARGSIKCIGATTKEEYKKHFSNDKALMRRFEIINVSEPTKEETKDILVKIKKEYEDHHNVIINERIIDNIVNLTDKYILNKKNPDKSIEFLDSVCSKAKINNKYNSIKKDLNKQIEILEKEKENSLKNKDYDKALNIYNRIINIKKIIDEDNNKVIVKEKDVLEVLEDKTNIIFNKNKLSFLDNISNNIIISLIKNNLINKECFLRILLKRYKDNNIVNLIKDNYPKCNYIRIDLKEYKNNSDINKLIGSSQGYVGYNDDHVLSSVKNSLFNIILFDNYHYAHDSIKNIVKKILKDKFIEDNKGDTIYFNNSIIFITNDIINNNKIGFNNISNNYDELESLVDNTVVFSE